MAKRFTDTNKWDKDAFSSLSLRLKLAWVYLCDKCDHAGVWDVNLRLMSFQLGEDFTLDELASGFGDAIEVRGNKLVLTSFIEFQYGKLNPENRVHRSVLERLEKLAPNKPNLSPFQGAKDKDKDKYKDKEKDKEREGGVGETNFKIPPSALVAERKPMAEQAEGLEQCYRAWLDTLAYFKASRPKLSPAEQVEIVRAVQRQGGAKIVLYALIGARHEKRSETYNPADFLKINRVLDPEHFNRFMNLGIQAEHKKAVG